MIKAALDSYAATTNTVFAHDRSQTVGASEVGACARKVYWLKNEGDPIHGATRDPDYVDGWGARTRGTVFENEFWYPAMRARFGLDLHYAGPHQQTFVSGFLSATPDGLIDNLDYDALKHLGVRDLGEHTNCIMAECKTADPRTNLDDPKAENAFQVQAQMGIVRELTPYKPNYSLLSYTNASFWDEITEFAIPFDPAVYQAAKDRATIIMTARHAAELKPEGWIAGGRECEYCPYTIACGITRRSVPKDTDIKAASPQFVAEIADRARAIHALQVEIEGGESVLRAEQQAMRDRLREMHVRKVPGIVSWSSIKGRKTYDNKRIQEWAVEAGIDLEAYAKRGEETDRLTITAPKENA